MKQSIAKLRVANKSDIAQLNAQPLFSANPEAVLPLLSMIGQAQLSIDDLLGQLSRQFIEQRTGEHTESGRRHMPTHDQRWLRLQRTAGRGRPIPRR